MAAYYINNSGTETYPYDTEAKGAQSLTRLTKHLSGNNYRFLNHLVSSSYVISTLESHTPPFPILSQHVDFNTIITQYDIILIELAPGFWILPVGTNLGPTDIIIGNYAFVITSSHPLISDPTVTYTCEIKKNGIAITTFTKFTSGVSRTYTFRVSATTMELLLNGVSIYVDTHGFSSWNELFTAGSFPYRFSTNEVNSINNMLVTSMEIVSNPANPDIAFNNDTIYLVNDITEPLTYNSADNIPSDISHNNSTVTNYVSTNIWTLGNNNFDELNLISLNISGSLLGTFITINPTLVTDCTFTNSRAIAYITDTSTASSEISNNIFDTGTSYAIYVYDTAYPVRIFNNVFKDRSGYAAMYIDYSDTTPIDIIIVNNTFYGCLRYMLSGYIDDSSGAIITNLMLFNNVDNSVDGIEFYLYLAIPGNLGKFIHDHNNSSDYYYEVNSVEESPTATETSVDPLYTGTLPVPYELQDGSPCIGVGITRPETPPYDLIGVLRGDPPDLGALDKGATLIADFIGYPLSGIVNLIVNFTDLSTGEPTSWNWDFGDGSPHSSVQNPTHIYTSPGSYTVTLVATKGPFSDTEIKLGYIVVTLPPLLGINTGGGFTRTRGPTLIFD